MSEHTSQAVTKTESKSAVNPSSQGSVLQRAAVKSDQSLQSEINSSSEGHFEHDFSKVQIHQHTPAMLQAKLTIGQSGDQYEREADNVADTIMRMPDSGGSATQSIGSASVGELRCQPDDTADRDKKLVSAMGSQPGAKPNNYDEAAGKAGEAFMKTEAGKQVSTWASETFMDKPGGKVITGAVAAEAFAALYGTHSSLPFLPTIPLDFLKPGLSVKATYDGPVNKPTKVGFTVSFEPKKKEPTLSDKNERFRQETERIRQQQQRDAEGNKTLQQRKEDEEYQRWWLQQQNPLTRGQQPTSGGNAGMAPGAMGVPAPGSMQLQMPEYHPDLQNKGFNIPKLHLKDEDDETLQRKEDNATSTTAHAQSVPPIVHNVLHSSSLSLDASTRSFMESQFGHDFSGVRIHNDDRAAESARSVNALAYTVGRDVVFGAGQYESGTMEGRKLLAHELTHVVQQGRGGLSPAWPSEKRLAGDADHAAHSLVKNQGSVKVVESSGIGLARETNDERIERQKQSNFVNLPAGVQSIVSPPKQSDTSQPQNKAEKDQQAPATRRLPVDAQAWQDIELYPIVEDRLPSHDTFSPSSGTISSGIYRIHPLARNYDDPHIVYYAAYNTRAQRTEYAIGPAYLDFFLSHTTLYMIAAGNFFGISGPRPYELATGKVISRGMRGDLRGAVRALGESWLHALQDPNWWLQALAATAGMAAPEAEVASAEGKVPPAAEVAPVEGKVPPAAEATSAEGTTGAKKLEGSGPIPRSVGAASRAEMLAKKLRLNANSPTTRQVLNNLDMPVKDFIGKFRKGSILSEFPGEFLKEGVTIEDALLNGGSKVRKLLIDGRFAK